MPGPADQRRDELDRARAGADDADPTALELGGVVPANEPRPGRSGIAGSDS
jgi:hypothetical protein